MSELKSSKLIFCECCKEMKPWSTLYRGLQSRGELTAVCPACKGLLEQLDREAGK